jgi:Uma2 family endonuclease
VDRILPKGWFTRQEQPARIPVRRSEPEPDLSVVRGSIKDYATRHPGPEDVALVVEVTRSTVSKDRALARVYGGGGIPAYWIVDVPGRRLEVYENPVDGKYSSRRMLRESDTVSLIIGGQEVGPIAVADLFP